MEESVRLLLGSFVELMPQIEEHSVELIVTDPPYPHEFEHLYEELAREAKRALRIGGSLIAICGHYQLARVLPAMSKHLKYRWVVKLDQPGASARMAMGIRVTWKPMVWFVNEKFTPQRNVVDCAISDKRTKGSGHPWEQSEGYARWAIENLTDEGELVLDPMMGSGTTGIVSAKLKRRFIGMDISPVSVAMAKNRIGEFSLQGGLL